MSALDIAKNFAKATVSAGYTAGATSIVVTTGHGARLPAVPFNATWWNSTDYPDPADDPNVEIVRVTARATDTLTITRAQESTSATTKNTASKTYKLMAGPTAKLVNTDLPTVFTRKYPVEYDARDYLPNDGTTDATTALQALIDTIGTAKKNAIIELDDIDYVIGGALQDGSRRNAQILLPTIAITEKQYSIKIKGQTTPACSPSLYEPIVLPQGARIRSTLTTATGTQPSVISGRGPSGGYIDETDYLHAEFENIVFVTVPNPTYSCLNLQRITSVRLKDCIFSAGVNMDLLAATEPTTITSYGLILPDYNRGILCDLQGQINIFGFYTGMRAGELMHIQNLGLWWCIKGIEFAFSYHASLIERLLILSCHAGAAWTGIHPVEIRQWDNEHSLASETAWHKSVYDVYDPSNYGSGDITWLTVRSSFGRESVFVVNGGANLRIRELGATSTTGGAGDEPPPIETGLWKWSASTSGVVSYEVGIDNATPTSATLLSIAKFSDTDFDASEVFARLGSGDDVTLRDRNNSDKWIRYDITGAGTDAGIYWTFPINDSFSVTPTFAAGTQLFVTFTYGGSGSVPPSGLLYDTFSGTNGTLLQDHTPDIGPVWTKIEGTVLDCQLMDGTCRATGTPVAEAVAYTRDAGTADVTITGEYVIPVLGSGSHYVQFLLRASDSSNYISGQIFDLPSLNMSIVRHQSGTDTTLAEVNFPITAGATYTFTLTASGSSITFDVNGTELTATSAFNSTITNHGFRMYSAVAPVSMLDNHMVESSLVRPA